MGWKPVQHGQGGLGLIFSSATAFLCSFGIILWMFSQYSFPVSYELAIKSASQSIRWREAVGSEKLHESPGFPTSSLFYHINHLSDSDVVGLIHMHRIPLYLFSRGNNFTLHF